MPKTFDSPITSQQIVRSIITDMVVFYDVFRFCRVRDQLRDIPAEDGQPRNIRVVVADIGEIDLSELCARKLVSVNDESRNLRR